MSLTAYRYEGGKPVGLDWSQHNDGLGHNPEAWKRRTKDDDGEQQPKRRRSNGDGGGTKLRTPPEVEAAVIIRYSGGEPAPSIARDLHLQPATVYKILRRNGVETRTVREAAKLAYAKRTHA